MLQFFNLQDDSPRHLGLSKFLTFGSQSGWEGQCTSTYQISSKSVNSCRVIATRNAWQSLAYSRYTGPIFTIFSPYESALGADDRTVPRCPISQGANAD